MIRYHSKMSSLVAHINYWCRRGYDLSGITTDGAFFIATWKVNGISKE